MPVIALNIIVPTEELAAQTLIDALTHYHDGRTVSDSEETLPFLHEFSFSNLATARIFISISQAVGQGPIRATLQKALSIITNDLSLWRLQDTAVGSFTWNIRRGIPTTPL